MISWLALEKGQEPVSVYVCGGVCACMCACACICRDVYQDGYQNVNVVGLRIMEFQVIFSSLCF